MSGQITITARIVAAKAQLDAVHREVQAIAQAVDMFDLDAFGEAGRASLLEVLDSLGDVHRAIVAADEPFESAEWHARHLEL